MNTYVKNIDGKWYAFGASIKHNEVYSLGRDCPNRKEVEFACWNDEGIKYVANPSPTPLAAYKKASHNGKYCGRI